MEQKLVLDLADGQVFRFNKPLHWSSFNLVSKVRTMIRYACGVKKIKIGHAGTLDPLATGVLIVCTGKKTKEIDNFQYQTKEYVAELKAVHPAKSESIWTTLGSLVGKDLFNFKP